MDVNMYRSGAYETAVRRSVFCACAIMLIALAPITETARAEDRTYQFVLTTSHNATLCRHMGRVFNQRFRQPWHDEMDMALYGVDGKYAFPRLPWVEHIDRITVDMRFSKYPTSPEFEAIAWQEGRAISGQQSESGKIPFPVLIAYFDFDNDGQADTVMKESFMTHYQYRAGWNNARGPEPLLAWRNEHKDFTSMPTMWSLLNEVPKDKVPQTAYGLHQRPFIYRGQTLVARYAQDWGDSSVIADTPWYPLNEVMSIVKYTSKPQIRKSSRHPPWSEETLCEFQMKVVQ